MDPPITPVTLAKYLLEHAGPIWWEIKRPPDAWLIAVRLFVATEPGSLAKQFLALDNPAIHTAILHGVGVRLDHGEVR